MSRPPAVAHSPALPDLPGIGASGRPLAVHAALYGLVLAILLVAFPIDSSLGTDDGAYGGQVWALQQGAWELDRPIPVVDGANEGWFNSAITPDGPLPYTTNPSYVLLLRAVADTTNTVLGRTSDLGGDNAPGLQLVPTLGALAAACVAWSLATRWRRSAAPLAFWLVALGPVLINATSLWAHTLSSALAGLAVVGIIDALRIDRAGPDEDGGRGLSIAAGPLLLVAAASVGAAVVRTETLLWLVALAPAILLWRRSRAGVLVVVFGLGPGVAAWGANRLWGLRLRADRLPIETSVKVLEESPSWLRSRIPAAWELLLTTIRPGLGPVLILVALLLVGLAGRRLLSAESAAGGASSIVPLLGAASIAYLAVVVLAPGQLLAGTITAWPLVFLLLAARPGDPDSSDPTPAEVDDLGRGAWCVLGGSSALFGLAVIITQYASSGGLQWGGRYLSLAYVPVAVLAAIRGEALFRRNRAPLALLLLAPTIVGLAASYRLHTVHHDILEEVTERPSEVVVTNVRPLPRLSWTALPTTFYFAETDTVASLLADLADAEVATVNVYGLDSVPLDGVGGYAVVGGSDHLRHLELRTTPSPAVPDEGP